MGGRTFEWDAVGGSERGESTDWCRVVPALGVSILVVAVAKSIHTLADSGILLEAVLDLVLIGSLGAVVLAVDAWLPTTDIRPALYPRIAAWVLGGVAVMAIALGLRVLHPGVTVEFTFGTQAVFLAIGSLAGLGIGVHEARALVTADRLEAQNEELQRTEQRLEEVVIELEATNDELEATNDELADTNEELADANEQLAASNEQLEQFAHAASHDLREPLRMVRSYLELLERREDLDAESEEFLAFAADGAERMSDMIDGLLAYSRVETQGERFDAVDLDAVLDDVLADLQFAIEESDCEVEREPLPTVAGDGRQLRQVFQNLVSNAIQYCGDDAPHVEISAEHERAVSEGEADAVDATATEPEGTAWQLSVRDHGIGMDEEGAERAFDVFQRLHETDEAGSGIGLALCERIVERHGGEIWIDAEPDEGSTFHFTLPAAEASSDGSGDEVLRSPEDEPVLADESSEADAHDDDREPCGEPTP